MSPVVVGRRVVRLAAVASTMDEVETLARAGEPEGTVVVADVQTAGRGRAGRRWSAPAGTSVLCSVLLRPRVPPTRLGVLPLVAGIAVAEAIEGVADVSCQLKWPNDVWIDGRKVAGVLVSARTGAATVEHAIVGVGINVNVRRDDLPLNATSVLVASGHPIDRERILCGLLERLDRAYGRFVASAGRPDLEDWRTRAALVGHPVTVAVGDVARHGRLRGVDGDGALLLELGDGAIERIVAGELTRGPVAADARRKSSLVRVATGPES